MSEKVYDEQVAPLLMQAMEICEQHGMDLLASASYLDAENGWSVGSSIQYDQTTPKADLALIYMAMKARGNLDRLIMSAIKYGERYGHNSLYLTMLARKNI